MWVGEPYDGVMPRKVRNEEAESDGAKTLAWDKDELENELNQIQADLDTLQTNLNDFVMSLDIRIDDLEENEPFITAPSGGAIVDTDARRAINDIRALLIAKGFMDAF